MCEKGAGCPPGVALRSPGFPVLWRVRLAATSRGEREAGPTSGLPAVCLLLSASCWHGGSESGTALLQGKGQQGLVLARKVR